jgi:hypothetical protein
MHRLRPYVITGSGAKGTRTTLGAFLLGVDSSHARVATYLDNDSLNCRRENLNVSDRSHVKTRIDSMGIDETLNIDVTKAGTFEVQACREGVHIYLGSFETIEIATAVRDAFRLGESYRAA